MAKHDINHHSPKDKFVALLSRIFELDSSDLDFGIYRFIQIKKKAGHSLIANLDKIVEEGIQNIVKESPEIDIESIKNEIYEHLYSFFYHYYYDGVFMFHQNKHQGLPEPQYKITTCSIPVSCSDVQDVGLFYPTKDQYYVGSYIRFKDYSYEHKGITVKFKLIDAEKEYDNIKRKQLFFQLVTEGDTIKYTFEDNTFTLYFKYTYLEDKSVQSNSVNKTKENIIKSIVERVGELNLVKENLALAEALLNKIGKYTDYKNTNLDQHLRRYMNVRTSDLFIHKDLSGFLKTQLDNYVKEHLIKLDLEP